jgi:hypothetical protein
LVTHWLAKNRAEPQFRKLSTASLPEPPEAPRNGTDTRSAAAIPFSTAFHLDVYKLL